MKKLLLHFFLLFTFHGFAQEYKMVSEELKGAVKSLEIFIITDSGKKTLMELKNFDSKRRLLESKTFYDGRLQSNERSTYQNNTITSEFCDNCNDLVKAFAEFVIKENQKNPYSGSVTIDPSRIFKTIKTTDKNGNVVVSKVYNPQGYLKWSTKSTFDKKSNLLLEENFDDEGKKTPSYKSTKYNKKGLIAEELTFAEDYESKSIYTYDNLNRKTSEKVAQGSRTSEKFFEYVTEKDTVKVMTYEKDRNNDIKILKKQKLSYTENGKKIIKEMNLNKGKTTAIHFFEFDKNNNLILETYQEKNELKSEIKLVYDKKGNWIEMDCSSLVHSSYNGSTSKPEWRTKKHLRTILYY